MASIQKLVGIVKDLRAPNGCPWDKEQTFKSLMPYVIEEAYELSHALDTHDIQNMKEELGDVLLHVVMISEMASEQQLFELNDVVEEISEKMIRRHPHVFGTVHVDSVGEVLQNWEAIKKTEKPHSESVMDSIPRGLPGLLQAFKMQKKASKLGFDWKKADDVFSKLDEEIQELKVEVDKQDKQAMEDELGDILFTAVNLCRKLDVNPEIALQRANDKFSTRFKRMETMLGATDTFQGKTPEQLDALWNHAKES